MGKDNAKKTSGEQSLTEIAISSKPVHPGKIDVSSTYILIAIAIALYAWGYFLAFPLRYDEAYTFMHFIRTSMGDTGSYWNLFYYPLPNNHVLNTLMSRLSVSCFGASPPGIRFPSFFAGLCVVYCVWLFRRSEERPYWGVAGALCCALFPYFIMYGVMARGYTLTALFTILSFNVGRKINQQNALKTACLVGTCEALGVLAVPIMLFSCVSVNLWISLMLWLNSRNMRTVLIRFLIPVGLVGAIFTLLFYSPVIYENHGIKCLTANRFVQSRTLAYGTLIRETGPYLMSIWREYTRSVPGVVKFIAALSVAGGVTASFRRRDWGTLAILPLAALGGMLGIVLRRDFIPSRSWIYIVPLVAILADVGFSWAIEWLPDKFQARVTGVLIFAGALFAYKLTANNELIRYSDTGQFNEAEGIVDFLREDIKAGARIFSGCPVNDPLNYALWREGLLDKAIANMRQKDSDNIKEFYIIKRTAYALSDLTEKSSAGMKLVFIGNGFYIYST